MEEWACKREAADIWYPLSNFYIEKSTWNVSSDMLQLEKQRRIHILMFNEAGGVS